MRKRMLRVGAGWFLLCAWSVGMTAQAGQQIIFEGSARTFSAVKSSGSGVPLLDALERIVPSSYSVNMPNAGAWAEMPVSWRPGAFVTVLGQVLAQDEALQARVNTDLQLVTVSKKDIANGNAAQPQTLPPSLALLAASEQGQPPSARRSTLVPIAMRETSNTTSSGTVVAPTPVTAMATVTSPAPTTSLSAASRPATAPALLAASASSSLAVAQPSLPAPSVTAGLPSAASSPSPSPSALMRVAQAPAEPLRAPLAAPETSEADATPTPLSAATGRTTWQLTRADGSIRNALSRWASESGWQFVWDVPTDFSIDAAATLHGTLEDALNAVVNALSTSQVPIQIVMYKGNRVLRVVAKGAG